MGKNSHNEQNKALTSRIQIEITESNKRRQTTQKKVGEAGGAANQAAGDEGQGRVYGEFKNSNETNYQPVCLLLPPCTAILNNTSAKLSSLPEMTLPPCIPHLHTTGMRYDGQFIEKEMQMTKTHKANKKKGAILSLLPIRLTKNLNIHNIPFQQG